jgi:hypothetical protein
MPRCPKLWTAAQKWAVAVLIEKQALPKTYVYCGWRFAA